MNAFGEREVALIADELSHAVELTLNPTVDQEARKQAYTACESFKENSPWCAQAGLLLASGAQYSPVVKHFGLQLMEHTVKYRWTQITQPEKVFIKDNAMKLLYMGGWETGHLNDALARVIVEMIKREWPQQWPTLLSELSDACSQGHLHTQIVLHVFLRLVEDVATLQTLEQHQRRKDIYQALTSNMAEIFAFFMRLIELHVQEFREKTAAGDYAAAASNGRVVQVVLLTLTGFVEWVSTNHVVTNNGRLLQILCILLSDDVFRLPAAECLLQVVNRKGSTKERKPLMILFSEDAISCIHRAALQSISAVDEQHYLFLKKLSQVLAGLGQQLTSLWNCATNVESWLPVLLETTLLLTSHPSLTLAHTANTVWLAFLKHEQISKLPHVLAMVPRWLQAAAPKVLKVTYPSSRVSGANDAVVYACIDYDSEQEFAIFFSRCRTEILESFRYCMIAAPLVTWSYVERWTQTALDKVDSCPLQLDVTHPLHVEWEALAQVLDVVLSRLLQAEPRPNVAEGLQLLQRCVASEPRAPLILSLLLSFISALFVFLSCAYSQLARAEVGSAGVELLPRVLDKIFAALLYEGTPPEGRSARAVKNVRRHAAGLLVKLGSKYPLLLLPVFPRLHEAARAALSRELSAVESVTLQEALLLVSNHFCCYERQSALVAQVHSSHQAFTRTITIIESWISPTEVSRLWKEYVAAHRKARHQSQHDSDRPTLIWERVEMYLPHQPCRNIPCKLLQQGIGLSSLLFRRAANIVLGDCRDRWAALSPHLQSAAGLARLIGLDAPPTDDDPERAQARRTLLHALTLTLGVVKRTQVPADPDKAARGGFGAGVTPSGNPVWRNPCGAHVLPLFPAALSLARALHELHAPHAVTLRHPAHARALQPPPAERRNLLGLRDDAPPAPPATPQDRMQNLLHTLHDNVCQLVGAAAASLGRELYGAAGLARALVGALLAAPERLPDHWLRRVLRAALRPLLARCPPAHHADVALPLLQHLAPLMLVHLNQRWEYVTSLYESGKLEEEGGSESQEVLEDMLVRHLTREHLELLKVSLVEGGVNTEPSTDMDDETPPANPGRAPEQVSELGAIILADPVAGPAVLHTILRALTWNDSTSSLRACSLALPALRAALSGGLVTAADASGALAAVLHALRLHGQHDANQAALLALAVQAYEALRPRFPGIVAVLRAIPDADAHDVARLDEKLSAHNGKPSKIDKSKRDLFKKITSRLIGRNVGQLFKKEVFILDLPTMHAPKEKPRSTVDAPESAGLENLFNANAPT